MDTCDVLIVGGGPAGSACAWRLRQAGLDVLVVDRSQFPRDKVCAGWVTPQVFAALHLEPEQYAHGRTLQTIRGFRVGMIGHRREVVVRYGEAVSFGIRRIEFDHYLLQRANVRLRLGEGITSIRQDHQDWIVNGSIRAPMLVGAGGEHCPVARMLRAEHVRGPVVAAQEIERPVSQVRFGPGMDPDLVGLYFSDDLMGYGWCFRKQDHVNIGFGRYGAVAVRQGLQEFAAFLAEKGIIYPDESWPWRGHSYRVVSDRRRVLDDGVLLIGDSAGLAYRESGEGIRPAVESGLLAASTIINAERHYNRRLLAPYEACLDQRFGPPSPPSFLRGLTASARRVAPPMLASPWLVRHVVLDRWFLHARQPALAAA